MLTLEKKICKTQIEKEKKEDMKNFYCKRKTLMNDLNVDPQVWDNFGQLRIL